MTEVYQDGSVVVAKMSKVRIVKGETLIVRRSSGRHSKAEVMSIQIENVDFAEVDAEDGQELGIRLSKTAKLGSQLLRLVPPRGAETHGDAGRARRCGYRHRGCRNTG